MKGSTRRRRGGETACAEWRLAASSELVAADESWCDDEDETPRERLLSKPTQPVARHSGGPGQYLLDVLPLRLTERPKDEEIDARAQLEMVPQAPADANPGRSIQVGRAVRLGGVDG